MNNNYQSKFRATRLASAISLTLLMTACGSSETASTPDEIPAPVLQSFTGKAADGYLSNALVCLDLNNNSICESNEPSAITAEGGSYEFNGLDETLDLSTVRLLVKVIAGQTVDEDNPGVVVEQSYSMSSPPGQIDFVSPITTLIDNQMHSNPEQTQEEAVQTVAMQLGIDSTDEVDLTGDYVEASSDDAADENKDQYQRLHHVAQAVAGAIAQVSDNLQTQIDTLEDSDKKDALAAIIGNVAGSLEQITQAIDEAEANGDEIKVQDIIVSIQDTIHIAKDELHMAIDDIKDQREAQIMNLQEALTAENGIYFLEQEQERFYDAQSNKCISTTQLAYGNFKVIENIGHFSLTAYDAQTGEFVAWSDDDKNEDFSIYTLGQTGWVLTDNAHNNESLINFADDGLSMTMTSAYDGIEEISIQGFEIAGESLYNVSRGLTVWHEALKESSLTFSDEAKAYYVKGEAVEDHYILPIWQGCSDSTGVALENCNAVRFGDDYQIATTLQQLMTTEQSADGALPANTFDIYLNHGKRVKVSLNQQSDNDDVKQTANFYLYNDDCYGDQLDCSRFKLIATSSWEIETINGQDIIQLDIPRWLDNNDSSDQDRHQKPFITVQDGQVRQGFTLESGISEDKAVAMNKAALEQVLAGFSPQSTRVELSPEACGIEQPQDNTIEDGKPDSEQPLPVPGVDEDQQPLPVPVIEADQANTSLLLNNTYFLREDDNDMLIRFKPDSVIRVASNEHYEGDTVKEVEYGKWTVDAAGQILVQMNNEWMLFKVEQGLGEEQMLMSEIASNDAQSSATADTATFFNLSKISAITINAFDTTAGLTVTRAEDCSLDIFVNPSDTGNGSGYIDAALCQSISSDQGAPQFEFLWFTGEEKEIIINPLDSNGQNQQEKIHLYSVTIAQESHLLMKFDHVDADGTNQEGNFELWKLSTAAQ